MKGYGIQSKLAYSRHREAMYAALNKKAPPASDNLIIAPKPFNEVEKPVEETIIAGVWRKFNENTLKHIRTSDEIHKIMKHGQFIYQIVINNQVMQTYFSAKDAIKDYVIRY